MKIGLLSTHGWNQQHFNSDGVRVANIGDSIREVIMRRIVESVGVDKKDIITLSQEEYGKCEDDVLLVFYDMINDDATIDGIIDNSKIHPVFVSCFFYDDIFLNRQDRISYFKECEPIGCRDEHSRDLCRKYGIEAYLVGCFSLCLPYRAKHRGETVFLVDLPEAYEKCLPNHILSKAKKISHAVEINEYPISTMESERLYHIAEQYIDMYGEEAKLIISGRLHAVLPAYSMGVPVIMINKNYNYKFGWLDKWLPLHDDMSHVKMDLDTCYEELAMNDDMEKVKQLVIRNIEFAILNGRNNREIIRSIDQVYLNRTKVELNKFFKKAILENTVHLRRDEAFNFAIWGAGLNGGYVYQVMQELYPKSKLVAIIDKYKSGQKYGVPIIRKEDICNFAIEHVVISSYPAVSEAEAYLKNIWSDGRLHYSVAVTQQNC